MKIINSIPIICILICLASCATGQHEYYKRSLSESAIPVRPGIPGERPFWNGSCFRFIYAPAFEYLPIEGAETYLYTLDCAGDKHLEFSASTPHEPLSPVWKKVPVGYFDLKVTGLDKHGKTVGTAGEGHYWRAAPFAGEYGTPPAISYKESAKIALDTLMSKYWVQSWLEEAEPHPDYKLYRYPSKVLSSLVIGALMHAKFNEGNEAARKDIRIATVVADYLLDLRLPEGSPWEWHTPTYKGYNVGQNKDSHIQAENMMTIYAADAGNAWLDLYDVTNQEKYLHAAINVARTYVKRQLPCGSWYLYVNYETNEPIADLITIPTQIINFFDRLETGYGVEGLGDPKQRALAWIQENVLQTFNWQGQFEDIRPHGEYENLSREQACDYAQYLIKNHSDNPESMDLAKELIRFSEDQFVIWDQPIPRGEDLKETVKYSQNWITPCVMEQLVFLESDRPRSRDHD